MRILNEKRKNLKFFLQLSFFIFLVGCGYKPSSTYQTNIVGDNINPIVKIDVKSPQETVFLKDALNDAVYTIFGSNIDKKNPNTTINLVLVSSSLDPLDYDKNGFPVLYRSEVSLQAYVTDKKNKKRIYLVSGTYDFSISSNSVINNQIQLDSFKKASVNALNKLLALITKDGMENEHK